MAESPFALHHIDDPIYKFKVNFLFGGTYDQFLDAIDSSTGIKTNPPTGKMMGCFWSCPAMNLYFLWLPRNFKPTTLGHEVIHIIYTMFNAVGVPTVIQNQESFAYHWEWWYEQVKLLTRKTT